MGAGGAMAPPDFSKSDKPISTRGRAEDYAHQIILPHPDFQTFRRPCVLLVHLEFLIG